ncbi:MAG: transposase orfA family [Ilumatobacteraceae bacterium]|nr:transposase orfA family [Ilumatobacteraceae bacterium]MCU1389090.1 transposase orfA family [Ilumatobacteraceae bacterium]
MPSNGKYPDEIGERAVRMVLDHQHEYGSQWEAMCSVAEKLGPKPETVRLWVRQVEKDTGRRAGASTDELAELKRLKRENAESRRANAISIVRCWSATSLRNALISANSTVIGPMTSPLSMWAWITSAATFPES